MDLKKVDEVAALRNYRAAAQKLHRVATSELIDLRIGNEPMDAFSIISTEPVRAAVREACDVYCLGIEATLAKMGVRVSDPTPPLEGTAEQWRRQADMYCQAWQRELRGHRPWKSHLIDSLVLGTRELVARVTGKAA